jgi:hypothetical protein
MVVGATICTPIFLGESSLLGDIPMFWGIWIEYGTYAFYLGYLWARSRCSMESRCQYFGGTHTWLQMSRCFIWRPHMSTCDFPYPQYAWMWVHGVGLNGRARLWAWVSIHTHTHIHTYTNTHKLFSSDESDSSYISWDRSWGTVVSCQGMSTIHLCRLELNLLFSHKRSRIHVTCQACA